MNLQYKLYLFLKALHLMMTQFKILQTKKNTIESNIEFLLMDVPPTNLFYLEGNITASV